VTHFFLPCQKSRPDRETACSWNLNSCLLLLLWDVETSIWCHEDKLTCLPYRRGTKIF
jgi:hypothetical protein